MKAELPPASPPAATAPPPSAEAARVAERYARRSVRVGELDRYSALQPDVWQGLHERQATLLRLLKRHGLTRLDQLQLLEIGCGAGGNLLEMLRWGFAPAHLQGVELLPERHAQARAVLPQALRVHLGDACTLPLPAAGFDIVMQSTVFSSLLDHAFQQRLADAMWRALKPGGAVLWYDFTVGNPRNPDVRGLPQRRVRALFPQASAWHWQRLTLAPPLARRACALHPGLYRWLNALPWLRTHALGWFVKPSAQFEG